MNSSIERISSAIIHRHRRARAGSRWTAVAVLMCGLSLIGWAAEAEPVLPKKPAHIVVVIEENHGFDNIIGSADAPYLNQLATTGAVFTQSYALAWPIPVSQTTCGCSPATTAAWFRTGCQKSCRSSNQIWAPLYVPTT